MEKGLSGPTFASVLPHSLRVFGPDHFFRIAGTHKPGGRSTHGGSKLRPLLTPILLYRNWRHTHTHTQTDIFCSSPIPKPSTTLLYAKLPLRFSLVSFRFVTGTHKYGRCAPRRSAKGSRNETKGHFTFSTLRLAGEGHPPPRTPPPGFGSSLALTHLSGLNLRIFT